MNGLKSPREFLLEQKVKALEETIQMISGNRDAMFDEIGNQEPTSDWTKMRQGHPAIRWSISRDESPASWGSPRHVVRGVCERPKDIEYFQVIYYVSDEMIAEMRYGDLINQLGKSHIEVMPLLARELCRLGENMRHDR